MIPLPRPISSVKLACTACQLVYTPDPADFETGNTDARGAVAGRGSLNWAPPSGVPWQAPID